MTGDSSIVKNAYYFFIPCPSHSICYGTPKKIESHSTGTYTRINLSISLSVHLSLSLYLSRSLSLSLSFTHTLSLTLSLLLSASLSLYNFFLSTCSLTYLSTPLLEQMLSARSFCKHHEYIFALLCLLNVNMGALDLSHSGESTTSAAGYVIY